MSNYRWRWRQWKSRRVVLAVTFLLNDVNRSIFFLPGLGLMLQAESRVREKAFSEWQMRNVSSSYRHVVPIWNGGVIAGRCFFWITRVWVGVAETVGWWNCGLVGWTKRGFLWGWWWSISVFEFRAPRFALDDAHCRCFLDPRRSMWRWGRGRWAKLHISLFINEVWWAEDDVYFCIV